MTRHDPLIVAIDIGNTNVVCGLYDGTRLVHKARYETSAARGTDGCRSRMEEFLSDISVSPASVHGIAIASVVPEAGMAMQKSCRELFGTEPLVVGPDLNLGISLDYTTISSLGTDRIVNAAAAFEKYGRALLVIDSGTATTFDVVTEDGRYTGGAIAPGVAMMRDALVEGTAQLPRVELVWNGHAIGRSTLESLQAGIVAGYIALVEGMIDRIKEDAGQDLFVIATGGMAGLVSGYSSKVDVVDQDLTLDGLRMIFVRNRH